MLAALFRWLVMALTEHPEGDRHQHDQHADQKKISYALAHSVSLIEDPTMGILPQRASSNEGAI